MVERIANLVLLVEDSNQERLLHRYLQSLGVETRNMRIVKSPSGRGAGEQFVREKYASEVRAIRVRMSRTRACLIVVIDADSGSVEHRRYQFQKALDDAEERTLSADEAIVRLIPKRNVETWILCLNLCVVNEDVDYRQDPRIIGDSIKSASRELFQWTRPNATIPDVCVDSLREGLSEITKIPS